MNLYIYIYFHNFNDLIQRIYIYIYMLYNHEKWKELETWKQNQLNTIVIFLKKSSFKYEIFIKCLVGNTKK